MMPVGSPARLTGTTLAVGAEKTPVKMVARAKREINEVFMMKGGRV